jgi:hypothetical protein
MHRSGQSFRERLAADWWRLGLLAALALLTAWRQPGLLASPRFWAEEGTLYFPYAYSHSFLQNLFHSELGYYTFYHSIITSLATLVPLEYAPTVTTWGAFLAQLGIGCLILWGDIPILDSRSKRMVVLLLVPMICYPRNWLNTLGVHFWLCILAFLLLIEAADREWSPRDLLRWLGLAVAGLTGVTTCFLTPVFILKAAASKSRRFIGHAAILSFCSLVQILVFLHTRLTNPASLSARFVYNNPFSLLKKVLIYQFAEPFLGHMPFEHPFGTKVGKAIIALFDLLGIADSFSWELEAAATAAGFCLLLFVAYLFCRTFNSPEYRYLIMAFLLVFVLSTVSSASFSAGPRYTFAPNAMLIVFAVSLLGDVRFPIARRALVVLVFFSLVIHVVEFRHGMYNLAYNDQWPKWSVEVQRWRTVPGYRPRIWPPDSDLWLEK